MQHYRYKKLAAGLLIAAITWPVLADDQLVSLGRYTRVKALPTPEQVDVLSALNDFYFSQSVSTVGEAIDIVLAGSGYSLERTGDDRVLLQNPLPNIHRDLPSMSFRTALKTLAGPGWSIETDEVMRKVFISLDKPDNNELITHYTESYGSIMSQPINYGVHEQSTLFAVEPEPSIERMAIVDTHAPSSPVAASGATCDESLSINIGDLLSQVVTDYLAGCGTTMPGWTTRGGDIIDYKFSENATIEMPNGIDSLSDLLRRGYNILLYETGEGNYSISINNSVN